MDTEWVDEFMASGRLRFTAFHVLRRYEHDERGDATEGRMVMVPEGGQGGTLLTITDAYVLSTSFIESRAQQQRFEASAALRIDEPIPFILALATQAADLNFALCGACFYRDGVVTPKPDVLMPDVWNWNKSPEELLARVQQATADQNSNRSYFMKPTKFADQTEFRFMVTSKKDQGNYAYVMAPEAVRFCQKLSL